MHERQLPPSPNWYCSRCSDTSAAGILGFGARSIISLIDLKSPTCTVVGELVGHKERVSGFSFCQHAGQSHLCASSSDDGTIKFWDSDEKVFIKEHTCHQSTIRAVHWSPVDQNLVVSGEEKGVVVCYWYHTGDSVSFFPEPRSIFCLSCSPHTWNHVAVGYKDGMIVLIDVSKKGEVVHRLRGHDDEIHSLAWAPMANEEALRSITIASNGLAEEGGCYLASGSKDQTVRVWSTAKGKAVMTLKLPYLKRRGVGLDPGIKDRLWLSVHWPKGKPTQLVSSCFSGELLVWDLTKVSQKWTVLGSSCEGQNHSRIVFNMSSVCLQDDRQLLLSTSMDREIKCWDLENLDCVWTLPTLGGFVYTLTFSPVGTGCLGLGVGDSMIRVWSTISIQNQYDTKTFWQGIKSKVTALAWHPTKEGSLAFGTDDGKVGIYDVFSTKPPQVSNSYHRKTVYTLAWGPPVPPLSFGGAGDKPSYTLYSCAGEGLILQHDPWKLAGDASDIDKLIRDTNGIKHKLSPHTDISWKPDGRVVAIGNEDGSIEVYQAPSLKLLCSIQQHHKVINVLRWHHEHGSRPELGYLLASGSNNAKVFIHDLHAAIESPAESPVLMTEPYRTLCGHTAKITSLAWSPHHDARLATVCYDGTAQVWDVLTEVSVSNYRGHRGRLLCVEWSPVDPDLVWTGGDDFTVREWSVSKQEFTAPPKGKKPSELMDRMKDKPKKKKKKKPPSGTGGRRQEESPSPTINGGEEERGEEGEKAGEATVTQPVSDDEEEASRACSTLPPPASHEPSRKCFAEVKDKSELPWLRKKKPRSMLPLSTSMDHRPKEQLLQDCLTLATLKSNQGPPAGCLPGQGELLQLGLFSDRQALYRMFQEEEEAHIEAGHHDSVLYLRLWSGDVAGALQQAAERGELNDHLLSIAPMAGYAVWCRTVEVYVKQLCLQEQYLKASSHLLSINKLYEAIDLLQSHKLYREAIALAKARLPPADPVLKRLYTSWAAGLEKDGHLSTAAKCYLAADASYDAAKVIARKNDVASLRTAASLARVVGEARLSESLSLRCAKDLASAQDWVSAQEVLRTQDSLLAHRLHLCVTELLTVTLAESRVVTWSCVSAHPWGSPCHATIQDTIRQVWEEEFDISERSTALDTIQTLLLHLRGVENPPLTQNTPLRQVLSCVALHLSQAVLSWLGQDDETVVGQIWQAVALSRDAAHFSLSAELCSLLFPEPGNVSVCSLQYPKTLSLNGEKAKAAAGSLQACVHYHLLYRAWWHHSVLPTAGGENGSGSSSQQPTSHNRSGSTQQPTSHNSSAAETCAGDEAKSEATNDDPSSSRVSESVVMPAGCKIGDAGGRSDFDAWVLLSEAHAGHQATQRAMAEIQERLASMLAQHSRAQGTETRTGESQAADAPIQTFSTTSTDGPGSADTGKRAAEQESLLSLSTKMSEYTKELSELPDTVKMFPRPDVMECCLALLHLSRCSSMVSDSQQRVAKELLHKYGVSGSLQKASCSFLS